MKIRHECDWPQCKKRAKTQNKVEDDSLTQYSNEELDYRRILTYIRELMYL